MSDAKAPVADVTDEVFASAYADAIRYAGIKARGRGGEYADTILDAATDALLWARGRYDPALAGPSGFESFAARAVRVAVSRAAAGDCRSAITRPTASGLPDAVAASARQSAGATPLLIADLPEDLAFVVRLYFTDGYDLRDCGLLLGVGPNVVQRKLRQAAELLAPGRVAPVRGAGTRRLGRVDYDAHEA